MVLKPTKAEMYYKPRKVAEMLDVQPRTVVRWIHEGRLQAIKVGHVWRIPRSEVERLKHGEAS